MVDWFDMILQPSLLDMVRSPHHYSIRSSMLCASSTEFWYSTVLRSVIAEDVDRDNDPPQRVSGLDAKGRLEWIWIDQ